MARHLKYNERAAYFVKEPTMGNDLDKVVQRAVAFLGPMPKEDRYRPI